MKILVKFYVFDLPPGFADAELCLPDGSTVGEVLDACLDLINKRNAFMDAAELKTATVMLNGRWSDTVSPVADGDTLSIIRPMDGG